MIVVRRVLASVYEFVVGDDWRLAVAAVVAIGGVALLVTLGVDAWWFAPVAVFGSLAASLLRVRES